MRISVVSLFTCIAWSLVGCTDGSSGGLDAGAGGDLGLSPDVVGAGGMTDSEGVSSGGTDQKNSAGGGAEWLGSGGSVQDSLGTGGASTGGINMGGTPSGGSPSGGATTESSGGAIGAGGTSACALSVSGSNPGRVCIKGKEYYLNGINVAWDQWTTDLIAYDAGKFESLFTTLEASGGNSIRWWWFIDGENQLNFEGELVQPLSQNVFDNLDLAFDAAAAHGVLIMPVLLSFDINTLGREFLVTNEAATDAFVTNVVMPLVARYNDHPAMGLWEIMNEGDWLLSDEEGTVSIADYQRFHAKVAAGMHAADSDALVTTGSASFKYLSDGNNILADDVLEAAAGGDPLAHLDVYQTHYYSWMHGDGWSYEPWTKTSTEWLGDGKPILIGEFACKGEEGRWSSMQMHVESVNQGYAGTFCWAYFDNRADEEGNWEDARPGVEAIAAQIPNAIAGQ